MKQSLFGVLGFILFWGFSVVDSALAATNVGGTIAADTTWNASSSPYIVIEKVTVPVGVVLTLEPGVIVKLRTKGMQVDGSLVTQGSESEPVHFTAQTDDSVGGDSNGDGGATVPTAGSWQGIQFGAGSVGTFAHTHFRYAGFSRSGIGGTPLISTLQNLGGTLSVSNTKFSHSPSCAIGQTAGSVVLSNSATESVSCGLIALGGSVAIHGSAIQSTNTGLFINGVTSLELKSNTFISTVTTADINLGSLTSFVHEDNMASGGQFAGLIVRGVLSRDLTLTADALPYIVSGNGGSRGLGGFSANTDGNLTISPNATLTALAGAVFKFTDTARIITNGSFRAMGESSKNIYLTSMKDDTVGGDTNGDGGATTPARGDWNQIQWNTGALGELSYVTARYGGRSVGGGSLANIYNNGGTLTLTNSELGFGGQYGLRHNAGTTTISESFIHDSPQYGVINTSISNTSRVHAQDNYWNSPTGPTHSTNPTGTGERVSDKVLFTPWKYSHCTENCLSSVLFLPGIMGSHLYEDSSECFGFGERRRWFSTTDCEQLRLLLDENGSSVNDIYTKATDDGVADQADFYLTLQKLYTDFFEKMNALEDTRTIHEFKPFAYDWRLKLDNLLYTTKNTSDDFVRYTPGISYKDGHLYKTLKGMVEQSKSGRVTVVAHSNGGLLAKTLLQKLQEENDPLLAKIDNLVLVAVPQVGTPDAVTGILQGTEIYGGYIVSQETARTLMNNGPFGYHLLPNQHYFEGDGASVSSPVIVIDSGTSTDALRTQFGSEIDSFAEMKDFMGPGSGRIRPASDDLHTPEVANEGMLTYAEEIGDALASWTPPITMQVHQLAGAGIWTPKTLHYYTGTKCIQTALVQGGCARFEPVLQYDVYFTKDGDGTVVLPSALGMREEGNVKRSWLNLSLFNDANDSNNVHKNIMEVSSVSEFIADSLRGRQKSYEFITDTSPNISSEHLLVYRLHSPLDLYIDSSEGRVSSTTNEIPGAFYRRFGEVQYVGVPSSIDDVVVHLDAYAAGSFTLATEEWSRDGQEIVSAFSAIPTATTSRFLLNLEEDKETMDVDFDGDSMSEALVHVDRDVIEVPVVEGEEIEEGADLPQEEVREDNSKTSKYGSKSKKRPQGQVAGASTSSDTVQLEKMIQLLQEIIRLTILLKQHE